MPERLNENRNQIRKAQAGKGNFLQACQKDWTACWLRRGGIQRNQKHQIKGKTGKGKLLADMPERLDWLRRDETRNAAGYPGKIHARNQRQEKHRQGKGFCGHAGKIGLLADTPGTKTSYQEKKQELPGSLDCLLRGGRPAHWTACCTGKQIRKHQKCLLTRDKVEEWINLYFLVWAFKSKLTMSEYEFKVYRSDEVLRMKVHPDEVLRMKVYVGLDEGWSFKDELYVGLDEGWSFKDELYVGSDEGWNYKDELYVASRMTGWRCMLQFGWQDEGVCWFGWRMKV